MPGTALLERPTTTTTFSKMVTITVPQPGTDPALLGWFHAKPVEPLTYAPGRRPVARPTSAPSAKALIAEVRRVATSAPTYIYPTRRGEDKPTAFYVAANSPTHSGCLLGVAMLNLGVDPAVLTTMEGKTFRAVATYLGIHGTDDEILWLRVAQGAQDSSLQWSEAVAAADRRESGAGYTPMYTMSY